MWSNLASDLLFLIFNSETLSVIDVVSFSSVCTSWRLAAVTFKHLLQFRRQSPLLMFLAEGEPYSAQLYSLANKKVYTIPNQPDPRISHRIIIGSAHGWLITADMKSELSLLNPITRQQIELPPITTLEPVRSLDGITDKYDLGAFGCKGPNIWTAQSLRFALYDKATISSSPALGDYVVALLLHDPFCLAFARAGDKKWTTMSKHVNARKDIIFLDDGKLYTTRRFGHVEMWDLNQNDLSLIKPKVVFKEPWEGRQKYALFYLVPAPWGEMLLVQRNRNIEYGFGSDGFSKAVRKRVEIWKIEFGRDEKLVKLESLGDYALFLGGNISTCVSSKDNPELRSNCVYLVDEFIVGDYIVGKKGVACILSLEDGSIERILPNHSMVNWSIPTWIMPSLA